MESDAREKRRYSLVVDKKGRGVESWKSRDVAFLASSSGEGPIRIARSPVTDKQGGRKVLEGGYS